MANYRKKLSKKKEQQLKNAAKARGEKKVKYELRTIRSFDTGQRIRIRTPVTKSGILAPPSYSTLVKKYKITQADKKWLKNLNKKLNKK